jgi:hypothetical protein
VSATPPVPTASGRRAAIKPPLKPVPSTTREGPFVSPIRTPGF